MLVPWRVSGLITPIYKPFRLLTITMVINPPYDTWDDPPSLGISQPFQMSCWYEVPAPNIQENLYIWVVLNQTIMDWGIHLSFRGYKRLWDVLLVLRINGLFHLFLEVGWIRPVNRS